MKRIINYIPIKFKKWKIGYDTDNKYWRKEFFWRKMFFLLVFPYILYIPTILILTNTYIIILLTPLLFLFFISLIFYNHYELKYSSEQRRLTYDRLHIERNPKELKRINREKKLNRIFNKTN